MPEKKIFFIAKNKSPRHDLKVIEALFSKKIISFKCKDRLLVPGKWTAHASFISPAECSNLPR